MTRRLDRGSLDGPALDAGSSIATLVDESTAHGERTVEVDAELRSARSDERYRLAFEIASGGMATVYLALMEGPGGFARPVALKRIHDHLAKRAEFVRMFEDEARISAQIVHPNVCQVHDFGIADGRYYLAMEYLMGETLSRVIPRAVQASGPADPRYRALVAYVFREACDGLHAAHTATAVDGTPLNVVHRDVSPHNLLVSYAGQTKVLDFGIARAADRTTRTRTGEIKGSLAYTSPEQVQGADTDLRSDVWSLGVCLYECLAGQRLFRRDSPADTLFAVVSAPIPSLAEVQPAVPAAYRAVVERALMRDPERRWPSAAAMRDALVEAQKVDGVVITAPDVARWMDTLFVDGRERALDLVRRAKTRPAPLPAPDAAVSPPLAAAQPRPGRARWVAVGVAAAALLLGAGVLLGRFAQPSAGAGGAPNLEAVASSDRSVGASGEAEPRAAEASPLEPVAAPPAAEGRSSSDPEVARDDTPAAADADAASAGEEAEASPPVTPAARRRDRPAGRGSVNVVVAGGWGVVYRGARRLGQTPLTLELPAGRHVLTVRVADRPPGRRVPVRVRPGETTPVVVRAR